MLWLLANASPVIVIVANGVIKDKESSNQRHDNTTIHIPENTNYNNYEKAKTNDR